MLKLVARAATLATLLTTFPSYGQFDRPWGGPPPPQPRLRTPFDVEPTGRICRSEIGTCKVRIARPIGASCSCRKGTKRLLGVIE